METVPLAERKIGITRGEVKHRLLLISSFIVRQCIKHFENRLEEVWENSEAGKRERMNRGEHDIWW